MTKTLRYWYLLPLNNYTLFRIFLFHMQTLDTILQTHKNYEHSYKTTDGKQCYLVARLVVTIFIAFYLINVYLYIWKAVVCNIQMIKIWLPRARIAKLPTPISCVPCHPFSTDTHSAVFPLGRNHIAILTTPNGAKSLDLMALHLIPLLLSRYIRKSTKLCIGVTTNGAKSETHTAMI